MLVNWGKKNMDGLLGKKKKKEGLQQCKFPKAFRKSRRMKKGGPRKKGRKGGALKGPWKGSKQHNKKKRREKMRQCKRVSARKKRVTPDVEKSCLLGTAPEGGGGGRAGKAKARGGKARTACKKRFFTEPSTRPENKTRSMKEKRPLLARRGTVGGAPSLPSTKRRGPLLVLITVNR